MSVFDFSANEIQNVGINDRAAFCWRRIFDVFFEFG
jgi:hypothetical protein